MSKNYEVTTTDLSDFGYRELAILGNYFEKMGRRYGLLTEFRENGIC